MATEIEYNLINKDRYYDDYIKIVEACLNGAFKFGGDRNDLYQQAVNLGLNFKILCTVKLIDIETSHLSNLKEQKWRNTRALDRLRKGEDPDYDSLDEQM
jgi:hypothetical protein